MLLRNYTPFSVITFESRDPKDRDFGVLVVRGTFTITENKPIQPCPEQLPIVTTDGYYGEPATSSLKMESDLAPYKPNADVYLNATAYAPAGEPASSWLVRIEIGKLKKELRVTGPRNWTPKLLGGWKLSSPAPVDEVPIRYEYAFGGMWGDSVFEQNPIGLGYVKGKPNQKEPIKGPQVESPNEPILELGREYAPQGFGAIARSWLPRRALAGTYDEKWQKERWPLLPKDFNFSHYHCAPGEQIYPGYLEGNERITLEGLSKTSRVFQFSLPGYHLFSLFRYEAGPMIPMPLNLDTLLIDLHTAQVHLTWRETYGIEHPIRVIEVRMTTQAEAGHGNE